MKGDALERASAERSPGGRYRDTLYRDGYLFIEGQTMRGLLAVSTAEVDDFAAHWPRLALDRYMADGGTYRYRRYGAFDAVPGRERLLKPHGPYEQPRYINPLNGGVERWFEPLEPTFVSHRVLGRLLDWLTMLYDQCEGASRRWDIRLHPYRIVTGPAAQASPTPEGLHRDGVDYIVSLMVKRHNVAGGETTVTDTAGRALWQKTLGEPMDILIADDAATMHSVTPVTPVEPGEDAHRDVLVIAFTKVSP